MRAIAYLRCSTEEQRESGAGMDAQRSALTIECQRREWTLVERIEDAGFSAKDMRRPGIQRALTMLKDGEADALIVSKLDRLSRSMLDFAGVMERARKEGWALIALDCAVDTTTPAGEMLANVLCTFAQFERRLIGQRTADALAARRAAGVTLGRPVLMPEPIRQRIRLERDSGLSLAKIAAALNQDAVPTVQQGRQWYGSTVNAALRT